MTRLPHTRGRLLTAGTAAGALVLLGAGPAFAQTGGDGAAGAAGSATASVGIVSTCDSNCLTQLQSIAPQLLDLSEKFAQAVGASTAPSSAPAAPSGAPVGNPGDPSTPTDPSGTPATPSETPSDPSTPAGPPAPSGTPAAGGEQLAVGDQVSVTLPAKTVTGTVTEVNSDGTVTLDLGDPSAETPTNGAPTNGTPSTEAPGTGTPVSATPDAGKAAAYTAADVLAAVNAARTAAGQAALTDDPGLDGVAQAYAQAMAALVDAGTDPGVALSHVDQAGNTPTQRGDAAGVKVAAENIAEGYDTPAELVTGWMNSPGHKKNIVNPKSTKVGTGVAVSKSGVVFVVQDFDGASADETGSGGSQPSGAPQSSAPASSAPETTAGS